ncbi:MAG: transport permease protein [Patescibacteria group bacterium]|nr:MAG: transport permease protein [Patescibacteria group bacterium]
MEKIKKGFKNLKLLIFYRELLFNLAYREINQRYKQSILGYAWVILNPLFQLLVLSFVFSTIFRVSSYNVPYIIFLIIGLLPWNFFTQSLSSSANALVSNASLITKIYFPREILIYATIIAKAVDFFYSVLIAIFFFIFYKISVNLAILWVIPIFIIQLFFTAGLSLIISSFNLFYRDIQYLLNLIIQIWFYLTPIIYPVEQFPEKYRFIFSLNPMSVIINGYRQVILGGKAPNLNSMMVAAVFSIVFFGIAYLIFKKQEGEFADYV